MDRIVILHIDDTIKFEFQGDTTTSTFVEITAKELLKYLEEKAIDDLFDRSGWPPERK